MKDSENMRDQSNFSLSKEETNRVEEVEVSLDQDNQEDRNSDGIDEEDIPHTSAMSNAKIY